MKQTMPIEYRAYKELRHADRVIYVFRKDIPEEKLTALLPQAVVREACERFKSSSRRQEWLMTRFYLSLLLPPRPPLSYYPNGKPYLMESDSYLSISHCRNFIVIALSHKEIGVDVEVIGERAERVKGQFFTDKEIAFCDAAVDKNFCYTLFWSAKEAIYKYCGQEGLSPKKQISLTMTGQTIMAEIIKDKSEKIAVEFECFDGVVLAYTSS